MAETGKVYKTLLQEEREKRPEPRVSGVNKSWWKKEKEFHFSCPYVEDFICKWSKKFRAKGSFVCSGSWHQTCEIYLKVKNNNEDPTVLIVEG